MLQGMGAKKVMFRTNSQFVAWKATGVFSEKEPHITKYVDLLTTLSQQFAYFQIDQSFFFFGSDIVKSFFFFGSDIIESSGLDIIKSYRTDIEESFFFGLDIDESFFFGSDIDESFFFRSNIDESFFLGATFRGRMSHKDLWGYFLIIVCMDD